MNDYDAAIAVEDDAPLSEIPPAEQVIRPLDYSPLQTYYGYDLPTDADKDKMQFVWEYFAADGLSPGETLESLRALERTLARPELGQSRLDRLYSFIRIARAADDTNAELRAYLR